MCYVPSEHFFKKRVCTFGKMQFALYLNGFIDIFHTFSDPKSAESRGGHHPLFLPGRVHLEPHNNLMHGINYFRNCKPTRIASGSTI